MERPVIRFLRDESGATAVEYGLIVALISLALLSAITTVGIKLNAKLVNLSNGLH